MAGNRSSGFFRDLTGAEKASENLELRDQQVLDMGDRHRRRGLSLRRCPWC